MPEPTDHRAEAEAWLDLATKTLGTPPIAQADALIGIGHWLGAIHAALLAALPAPYDTRWGPEVVLTKEQSDAIHAILND